MISVIIPIYKGNKYIKSQIKQIESAAKKCSEQIEVLFINDFPNEPMDKNEKSDVVGIRYVEMGCHKGIHGARIYGIEKSAGEDILMLDQDDEIYCDYFRIQLQGMENADASVCASIEGDREYYIGERSIDKIDDPEIFLGWGNTIISPGQVLIKRDAISEVWLNNPMSNNGADDWLLWICLFKSGRTIIKKKNILFRHNLHSDNTSSHNIEMGLSGQEMISVIAREQVLDVNEFERLSNTVLRIGRWRLSIAINTEKKVRLLSELIKRKHFGVSIFALLKRDSVKKLAIYGAGEIGQIIHYILEDEGYDVVSFIDRNADSLHQGVKAFLPEEYDFCVDAVIISLISDEEEAEEVIGALSSVRTYRISDIMFSM